MSSPLTLLVGLGNPGSEYDRTRHNAGVWWINALSNHGGIHFKVDSRHHASHGLFSIGTFDCRLAIPLTYMNESGQAVQALQQYYKISPQQILIIHDDIDLPAGHIRFKQGGGTGGHNGLKSIEQHLNTRSFNRLRIGVGHPGDRDAVKHYVLKPPNLSDQNTIDECIQYSLNYIEPLLSGQFEYVMQQLHKKAPL